jgi:hypothetical protein
MSVRVTAAGCLLEMTEHSTALNTSNLEGLAMDCFKANNNVMVVAIFVIMYFQRGGREEM